MSTEQIKQIVNQYFDNELGKGEEVILFTQLSQDQEAREYFKEMNALKSVIQSTLDEFPDELDINILSNISTSKRDLPFFHDQAKIFSAVTYTFALLLLVVSIFFYNESTHYKEQIEMTYRQVDQQNKMINVLLNSLPQTEVRAEFANEIIVTPKM